MAKINLDTEPRFKALMKELGFKKKGYFFIRDYKESVQSLGFGHSTHGEKHVRYYDLSYGVDYPLIERLANEIGEDVFGYGCHAGYLMPQNTYVEWRLAETDSDDYYLNLINEIISGVKRYVIPHMESISTIKDFVDAVEDGTLRYGSYDNKSLPIAYFLLSEKEKALKYIDNHLDKLAHDDTIGRPPEFLVGEDYLQEVYYPQENRDLIIYQEFAKKFKNVLLV